MSCGLSQSTDPRGRTEVFFVPSVTRAASGHIGTELGLWSRPVHFSWDQNDRYRWITGQDFRNIAPPWFIMVYPWFVTEFTCANVDSPSVSCRIVDIGVAIRFLVGAGDRAASPRLVPAVGRPLVLADALLRDRSHRLRQAGRNAVPLNLCMCINK